MLFELSSDEDVEYVRKGQWRYGIAGSWNSMEYVTRKKAEYYLK